MRYLAASPLMAPLAIASAQIAPDTELIANPDQALNVFDFEAVAKHRLPIAHYSYLATGTHDEATLRANREAYSRLSLRVRRLVDVRNVDVSVTLFGTVWDSPIVLAPVGSQRAFHLEGEIAVAKAARARNHLQILSTVTSTSVEEVSAARGASVWYQLYATDQWRVTDALVKRVEAAGCPALVLTVDVQGGSSRESLVRARRRDTRDCTACHTADPLRVWPTSGRKPMFAGLDTSAVRANVPPDMDWSFVGRVRALWPRKFLLKGIVTGEDAELAVQQGVDGLIVSNHGGRAEESGRATIDSLREVVDAVQGRVPVLVDGGIRRGTDIFKALAIGASAVCIGRPYVWGLAAFGQPGVEAVLDILRRELLMAMRQAGTVRIADINRSFIVDQQSRG
jgi:isopentenyl diphosphate isomerase/L-lactate dehydrogenase-like FMN-dependent dehydrogenase